MCFALFTSMHSHSWIIGKEYLHSFFVFCRLYLFYLMVIVIVIVAVVAPFDWLIDSFIQSRSEVSFLFNLFLLFLANVKFLLNERRAIVIFSNSSWKKNNEKINKNQQKGEFEWQRWTAWQLITFKNTVSSLSNRRWFRNEAIVSCVIRW